MTSLSSMIKYTKSLDYYKTSLKCMKERCFVDTEGPWPWAAEPPSSVYWMIAPPGYAPGKGPFTLTIFAAIFSTIFFF